MPLGPGPEEVRVGDVAGEPADELARGVEGQLIALHAERVDELKHGGREALDEEKPSGGAGGGDGRSGQLAENVLRLQTDVLRTGGRQNGGEENLVGDGRQVVRQRLVVHLVQGGHQRGQLLEELRGVVPGGGEQHDEVLGVRREAGPYLDVLGDEEELIARQGREGEAHARVEDLAEEVAGGGGQLLRVTAGRNAHGSPCDGGGHGRDLVLQHGGESRPDRVAVLLFRSAHGALFFLLPLGLRGVRGVRGLQHLVQHAQERGVVEVQ